jgi:hypothetical protein
MMLNPKVLLSFYLSGPNILHVFVDLDKKLLNRFRDIVFHGVPVCCMQQHPNSLLDAKTKGQHWL